MTKLSIFLKHRNKPIILTDNETVNEQEITKIIKLCYSGDIVNLEVNNETLVFDSAILDAVLVSTDADIKNKLDKATKEINKNRKNKKKSEMEEDKEEDKEEESKSEETIISSTNKPVKNENPISNTINEIDKYLVEKTKNEQKSISLDPAPIEKPQIKSIATPVIDKTPKKLAPNSNTTTRPVERDKNGNIIKSNSRPIGRSSRPMNLKESIAATHGLTRIDDDEGNIIQHDSLKPTFRDEEPIPLSERAGLSKLEESKRKARERNRK